MDMNYHIHRQNYGIQRVTTKTRKFKIPYINLKHDWMRQLQLIGIIRSIICNAGIR
jgi:hypothetical protein